jgi:hypothetical protein
MGIPAPMRGASTIPEPGLRPPTVTPVRQGDYFCSDRDLYYVESRGFDRVILEDCRTGALVDASVEDVRALRPVSRLSREGQT